MIHEQAFLQQIQEEPENPLPRLIYADWLEERGNPRSELIRIQEQLRRSDTPERLKVEDRMQELLGQGVKPIQISYTNWIGISLNLIFPGELLSPCQKSSSKQEEQSRLLATTVSAPFWIAQSVVTQGHWEALSGPDFRIGIEHPVAGDDYPMTNVNWHGAVDFCNRLTVYERIAGELGTRWRYALPTEVQWEYACRSGTTTPFSFGRREDRLPDTDWYAFNTVSSGQNYPHQVKRKRPNPWGLYDMHGNVSEWCYDSGGDVFSAPSESQSSHQGEPCSVIRGGNWMSQAEDCKSSSRERLARTVDDPQVGFRIALVLDDSSVTEG